MRTRRAFGEQVLVGERGENAAARRRGRQIEDGLAHSSVGLATDSSPQEAAARAFDDRHQAVPALVPFELVALEAGPRPRTGEPSHGPFDLGHGVQLDHLVEIGRRERPQDQSIGLDQHARRPRLTRFRH